MKKIIAMVLCLLLVTAMSVSAFAAGASFTVDASAKTLYRGDTVTLTVNVACGEKATSYGLMLDYDSNVFELVEGSCTVAGTLVSSFNEGFAFMFQNPTAYTGAVGTVTLKVKDDATFGDTTITGDASIKNGTDAVEANGFSVSLTVDCKHNYGAWVESGDGHSQTCATCNDVKTADHTWNSGEVTTKPTHYEEGVKTFTCSDCKATKTEAVAKLEAHEWSEWTATDDGKSHTRECGCGISETFAHEWSAWTADGENYVRECADCDASETIVVDGSVNTTVNDTPANTNISNTDIELIEKLLSDEEQSEAAKGASVEVYLEVADVTETVSDAHKTAAEAKAGDAEIAMYLDINLFKQIGGNLTQITETNGAIAITLTIPDELINDNTTMTRTYSIVRVHEDASGNLVTDVIEGKFNSDDNTFTFESDKFSTFALAYADKNTSNRPNVPGAVVPPSTSNLPTTSTTPNTPAKPNASTGGENSAVWALAVLMLTAGCAVAAKKSHKNVSER